MITPNLIIGVHTDADDSTENCRDKLKKWKSLEGDWKTFKDMEGKQSVHSEDGETNSSDYRLTPERSFEECDEQEWRSVSRSSDHEDGQELKEMSRGRIDLCMASPSALRLVKESGEKSSWSSDPAGLLSSTYNNDSWSRERRATIGNHAASYSFQYHQQSRHRDGLHEIVNSSYPLLKENFSLLEKLKRERDVCRQLENDMKDLEGQIQDVSKSFDLNNGDVEFDESDNESEGEISSEQDRVSPCFQQTYREDDFQENEYEAETTHFIGETDPLIVIEGTFSRLLNLAERLEDSVRERELELLELEEELHRGVPHHPIHTLPREWLRMERSRELSKIPAELISLLSDLQAALRALIACRTDRMKSREQQDRECSSPASFTYSASKVIVPTVRTIFSPVGNSVEMRPIAANGESSNCVKEDYEPAEGLDSRSESRCQSCEFGDEGEEDINHDDVFDSNNNASTEQVYEEDIPETVCDPYASTAEQFKTPEENGSVKEKEDSEEEVIENPQPQKTDFHYSRTFPRPSEIMKASHERCMSEITFNTPYNASSEIIKRIERLQELVKPELCESLKQRALKIQKAKEEFLSGVSMPNVVQDVNVEVEERETDIIVEKLSLPNGLSVRTEGEDKKILFPFLRKKKKNSWSNEELCRESLILEDKSDWLKNPFRPKGKYKINK